MGLTAVNAFIRLFTGLGVTLSVYTYIVEVKAHQDSNYQALCDINEHMSCTKAFTSEYGTGFGFIGKWLGEDSILNVPNGVLGMFFYACCFLISFNNGPFIPKILFVNALLSNVMSVYLAYVLYAILHDFCIVCISTYVVNALLTLSCYKKIGLVSRVKREKAKRS